MDNISKTKNTSWQQFVDVFGLVSNVMSVTGITLLWLTDFFKEDNYNIVLILLNVAFYLTFVLLSLSLLTFAIILVVYGYKRLVARRAFSFKFLYFTAVIPITYIVLGFLFIGLNGFAVWLSRWFFW
ncbi:hypothetical protein IQ260_14670 [Leptolyngbya cf. ectocarpi LEGE 11479]|uniref:Uncharacterized protein n=1 Tax=Leptolyngbya cf. ectocarpi LEGE 11479 TaxID=1828722 RepID=A0A928ZUW8_LEPEC|nr:hypothetical protein [Leptolyngbya ectocarpi]MBE9067894.1 hypothetical protein [Leptolyngbya cf. ectocarpi LEGE 11479]